MFVYVVSMILVSSITFSLNGMQSIGLPDNFFGNQVPQTKRFGNTVSLIKQQQDVLASMAHYVKIPADLQKNEFRLGYHVYTENVGNCLKSLYEKNGPSDRIKVARIYPETTVLGALFLHAYINASEAVTESTFDKVIIGVLGFFAERNINSYSAGKLHESLRAEINTALSRSRINEADIGVQLQNLNEKHALGPVIGDGETLGFSEILTWWALNVPKPIGKIASVDDFLDLMPEIK